MDCLFHRSFISSPSSCYVLPYYSQPSKMSLFFNLPHLVRKSPIHLNVRKMSYIHCRTWAPDLPQYKINLLFKVKNSQTSGQVILLIPCKNTAWSEKVKAKFSDKKKFECPGHCWPWGRMKMKWSLETWPELSSHAVVCFCFRHRGSRRNCSNFILLPFKIQYREGYADYRKNIEWPRSTTRGMWKIRTQNKFINGPYDFQTYARNL